MEPPPQNHTGFPGYISIICFDTMKNCDIGNTKVTFDNHNSQNAGTPDVY